MKKDPEMKPEQLKNARESLRLTQQEFGEELGKSERFITYLESGVRPISRMVKYAVYWLLLPKTVRKKWESEFLD